MPHDALSRFKNWLQPGSPKPRSASGSARAQLNRIETQQHHDSHKLDRISWHLTRIALSLSTCGPTAPTPPIATAPIAPASSASPSPVLRHGRKYAPKILAWLAEQALKYTWPILSGLLLSAWAVVRKYWQAIWDALSGAWTWLSAFVG